MARIIYETATTIDGYLADEQHSLSWLFAVPGGDDPQLAPPKAAVQVMGSTTYEWVLRELGALENMNVWDDAMPSTNRSASSHASPTRYLIPTRHDSVF